MLDDDLISLSQTVNNVAPSGAYFSALAAEAEASHANGGLPVYTRRSKTFQVRATAVCCAPVSGLLLIPRQSGSPLRSCGGVADDLHRCCAHWQGPKPSATLTCRCVTTRHDFRVVAEHQRMLSLPCLLGMEQVFKAERKLCNAPLASMLPAVLRVSDTCSRSASTRKQSGCAVERSERARPCDLKPIRHRALTSAQDPVHGQKVLSGGALLDIMDSQPFQRLRELCQLGTTKCVRMV